MKFNHPQRSMLPVAMFLLILGGCQRTAVPSTGAKVTSAVSDSSGQRAATVPEVTPSRQVPSAAEDQQHTLIAEIIPAPNGTFGYDILSDGRLLIHQTNIPGQPGVEGCRTKADAERLAALVIDKIRKGDMPPTVTDQELEQLQVLP